MNAGPALRLIAPRCSTEDTWGLVNKYFEIKNMIHLDIKCIQLLRYKAKCMDTSITDPKLKERSKIERSAYYYTRTKDDLDEEDDDEE